MLHMCFQLVLKVTDDLAWPSCTIGEDVARVQMPTDSVTI